MHVCIYMYTHTQTRTHEKNALSTPSSTWETCLAGKTNLPVDIRAESQKIAVWVKIGTALPCTTPRPAPKSSTDDLACDLWEERRPPESDRHTLWLG